MNESIGERLKAAREAKEMTLEEACAATKIQRTKLEAIEDDRIHEELDPAYAKIFLKKYASFLGLDGSAIVSEFLSLRGPVPERPIAVPMETAAAPKPTISYPDRRTVLVSALGVASLLGVSFLIYLAAGLYGDFKRQTRQTAVSDRREGPTVERAPAAARKQIIPKSQPLKLTVKADEDVWMQIKSDGSVIFQNVLSKGKQHSWTAQEELELWTGNASATGLHLNGKPLGPLGFGVKKGIRITREGLIAPDRERQ
ncbi:MAG: DUF4115 domain-containing protein [Candidatus Omnitrophica bacterium]|nr:DUF4115 domain-containing protein [Candidatus Omnitrophota bacterium]